MSTTTTYYAVRGMTCTHCENAVREEVGALPGVVDVAVSAADGTLTVVSTTTPDDATIVAAVDEAGYEAARS